MLRLRTLAHVLSRRTRRSMVRGRRLARRIVGALRLLLHRRALQGCRARNVPRLRSRLARVVTGSRHVYRCALLLIILRPWNVRRRPLLLRL